MIDKLMGKAKMQQHSSTNVEQFYAMNEETTTIFKFLRDEIVITNFGIYTIDIQGVSGSKIEYKYFPRRNIKYVSIETAGTFDRDFDIKIGIDGNTSFFGNVPHSAPISIKVPKKQTDLGKELYRTIKYMIDNN
jgi:hypothetical protein